MNTFILYAKLDICQDRHKQVQKKNRPTTETTALPMHYPDLQAEAVAVLNASVVSLFAVW
jgi:hypothetical protein